VADVARNWWWPFGESQEQETATRKAINGALQRLDDTTHGIREDHKLDQLIADIKVAQREGEAAMAGEGVPNDPQERSRKECPSEH
jgi:hypothetical protein